MARSASAASTASATMGLGSRPSALSTADLGWKFVSWGLGLFITGFLTGFVPIMHYMTGAVSGGVSPEFLKNVTLWWGCPAILAELTLKTGSLGMIGIGLAYLAAARQGVTPFVTPRERRALAQDSCGPRAGTLLRTAPYLRCRPGTLWVRPPGRSGR
ncbi:MAG: hypothetical protein EOP82_13530 [Variovorax sp.]|nr:MAG: hypothetical protein EOP82_13530 [Variovorax sp.]